MLIVLPIIASAQVTSVSDKQKSDATSLVNEESNHSLYAGAGYSNNMNYMGSDLSQNRPLFTGSLTYGFKEELFVSASTNHLSAFDQFLAFSAFTVSYNHDFNTWLDVSASISRYQVNSELTDTLFNNFFYGSLALGFDWNILYTNLSVGGIFSESSGAYFQVRNSRYIKTPEFLKGKAYFSFDPYVNLMLGTLTKTETSEGISIGVSPPFKSPKSSGQGSGVTTTTFFSLMEVDFGIPIGFNAGNLTVEAEPGYILPTYSDDSIESTKGFTLFLNIYYKIF